MTITNASGSMKWRRHRARVGGVIALFLAAMLIGCAAAQDRTSRNAQAASAGHGKTGADAASERLEQLEARLAERQAQIEVLVPKAYASYLDGDPDYVTDLLEDVRAAGFAWATYRDTHCRTDPMLQGMSRRASIALAEACRVEKTEVRLLEMQVLLDALRSNM